MYDQFSDISHLKSIMVNRFYTNNNNSKNNKPFNKSSWIQSQDYP